MAKLYLPVLFCWLYAGLRPLSASCQDSAGVKKQSFFLPTPVICSNPTAGLIYGAGMSYTYRPAGAHYVSVISSNATWSTKHMVNLNLKGNVFSRNERWLLNADWRLQDNTETTYGLGTDKPAATGLHWNGLNTRHEGAGQELHYQQIRFHQELSRLIARHLFAGAGLIYDRYQHISDDKTSSGDSLDSYHYRYSRLRGFRPTSYSVSGVGLHLLYDDRDNEVNAYKGYYLDLGYQVNITALGSTRTSQTLLADYRCYYPLDHDGRNVLAFWAYGNFLTRGDLPYLALPAIGYDQRQRTGRGYNFGRFRGEDLVYGESEYRFPLSAAGGKWGGVLFVNLTSTTDRARRVQLGDNIQIAYGGGLRFLLSRAMRSRLQLDAGVGQRSVGLYFGIQETF